MSTLKTLQDLIIMTMGKLVTYIAAVKDNPEMMISEEQ